MVNKTKKTLGLAFLGLSTVPYTFSKMEYAYQELITEMDYQTMVIQPICNRILNSESDSDYMFLYDKTTGYSIGSYDCIYNDNFEQCAHFFTSAKTADPYGLSFFLIQEKANLDIPEISRKYSYLENVKIERDDSGKCVLKDFSDYKMDHSLLKELKPQLTQFYTRQQELNAQWQELDARQQELNAQWQELEAQKQELHAQRQKLDTQYKELIARQQELNAQWQELDAQWQELDARLHELHTRLQEYNDQVHEFKAREQEINDQVHEFNARLHELHTRLQEYNDQVHEFKAREQEINDQRQELYAQCKEFANQKGELLNQAIGKQILWEHLDDYAIQEELIHIVDIAFNKSLISDAYFTQGCIHLLNTYEPLWTNKVSSLPENTFSNAIKIRDSFSPKTGISIENKNDKVFINGIDFQKALTKYLDSDRDDLNNTIFNLAHRILKKYPIKETVDQLKEAASNFQKGRGTQLELLSTSKVLSVYAVMKGEEGKNSLIWGSAEDIITKVRFHWFTDLKAADISELVNQYKDQPKKIKDNTPDETNEEPQEKPEQKKRKENGSSDFENNNTLKRLKSSK